MKRTCNKCKALTRKILSTGFYCRLYHPIKSIAKDKRNSVGYAPLENCEKPKTEKAFILDLSNLNMLRKEIRAYGKTEI